MSLLRRVRNPSLAARPKLDDAQALRDSVLDHLRTMVTTRKGTLLSNREFGIPEVSEIVQSAPEGVSRIAAALRQNIETFEPRLRNVVVSHIPSDAADLTLHYEVRAELIVGNGRARVAFHTTVDSARRVHVE